MTRPDSTSSSSLGRSWDRLHRLPGGTWLFSRLLGWMAPYTGTIGAHVRELRPGYARVTLPDRRKVRQHLRSIHAVALVNLGEVTSGLAMLLALPPGVKGIVTQLSTEYFKKARGTVTAIGTAAPPASVPIDTECQVTAEVFDAAGDLVSRTTAIWRLRPEETA
jgi:acyl-coenzyme A thioesterase PaaI-like protein